MLTMFWGAWTLLILFLLAGPIVTHALLMKMKKRVPIWLAKVARWAGKANAFASPVPAAGAAVPAAKAAAAAYAIAVGLIL